MPSLIFKTWRLKKQIINWICILSINIDLYAFSKVFLMLGSVARADSWVVTVITQESAHATLRSIKSTLSIGDVCESFHVGKIVLWF